MPIAPKLFHKRYTVLERMFDTCVIRLLKLTSSITPRKLADPMTQILKLIALIVSISLVFDSIHKIFVCIEKVNTHF